MNEDSDGDGKFIGICVVTWNLGNAIPNYEQMTALLPIGSLKHISLLAIGVQECDFTANVGDGTNLTFVDMVDAYLDEISHKSYYEHANGSTEHLFRMSLLCHKALGQIQLLVYAQSRDCADAHLGPDEQRVRLLGTEAVATGIGGVMANKGGVSVSVAYDDTHFCFVNSHLAAHQDQVAKRNADVASIRSGIIDIERSHHVIWMGDLNYRVSLSSNTNENRPTPIALEEEYNQESATTNNEKKSYSLPFLRGKRRSREMAPEDHNIPPVPQTQASSAHTATTAAKEHRTPPTDVFVEACLFIERKECKENLFMPRDQLLQERTAGRVFFEFDEAIEMISEFAPTFKLVRPRKNTSVTAFNYDALRMPSWCDRVLTKSVWREKGLVPLTYCAVNQVDSSDHMPVRATFHARTHCYLDRTACENTTQTPRDIKNSPERIPSGNGTCMLSFLRLRCWDLDACDANGFSDPYIVFSGDMLCKQLQTSVKYKTLSPEWNDEAFHAHLRSSLREDLMGVVVQVTVMDRDLLTKDDVIGYAQLPLSLILGQGPSSNSGAFVLAITKNDRCSGKLSGSVRISWPLSFPERQRRLKRSFSSVSLLMHDKDKEQTATSIESRKRGMRTLGKSMDNLPVSCLSDTVLQPPRPKHRAESN